MKRFLLTLLFIGGLGAFDLSWSQGSEPAEVARVVGSKKVTQLDKHIRSLSKRIASALQSGALTSEKADQLNAEVKAIQDKKNEFMAEAGTQQLTDVQFKELKAMWRTTAHKIPHPQHPASHMERFPMGNAK